MVSLNFSEVVLFDEYVLTNVTDNTIRKPRRGRIRRRKKRMRRTRGKKGGWNTKTRTVLIISVSNPQATHFHVGTLNSLISGNLKKL